MFASAAKIITCRVLLSRHYLTFLGPVPTTNKQAMLQTSSQSKTMLTSIVDSKPWSVERTSSGSEFVYDHMVNTKLTKYVSQSSGTTPQSRIVYTQRNSGAITWDQNAKHLLGANRSDGGDAGSTMYTDTGVAIRLINVLVKMKSQLGRGAPELGLVISPTQSNTNAQDRKIKENVFSVGATCRIKSITTGSPAFKTGSFREGDVIRRINMTDVENLQPQEVVSLLRRAVIDSKWTYSPIRIQVARPYVDVAGAVEETEGIGQVDLLSLMDIAIKKNSKMVASKKPNPIRNTLLQRRLCDNLDRALAARGYYDVTYHV
eukprot:m.95956 g.95956  ORF g.95956 m.95956 type:complete len:318 (-) comp16627_c0_seq1:196-1149(-)